MNIRILVAVFLLACVVTPGAQSTRDVIGLSLFFQNGVMTPLTFYGNAPRYVHEIDITHTLERKTDDGIDGLMASSPLDWNGVQMVEEDWRTLADGSLERQRFYRHAAWMKEASEFRLHAVDTVGRRLGPPLVVAGGRDDRAEPSDDFFIRRFSARQIARGCPSRADCTGARFIVQQVVQLRHNRNAASKVMQFPPQAAALELEWTASRAMPLKVDVRHAAAESLPYGYGFQANIDVSQPANGEYFVPGETVRFQVTFLDGRGRRLHPPGRLPTYGEFLRDANADGLDYYDNVRLMSKVYYALKHREANILVAMSGPANRLKVARSVLDFAQLQTPQAISETVAVGGYSGVFTGIPNFAISLGPPAQHETPVSDSVSFVIPKDAQPGTYVAAVKARRVFGGEAVNHGAVKTFQVGTTASASFMPATGNCDSCHRGPSAFDRILHGISDRRSCFGCHMALSVEPDNALDFRVHAAHSRSGRTGVNAEQCATCHLSPPVGPRRGFLPAIGPTALRPIRTGPSVR